MCLLRFDFAAGLGVAGLASFLVTVLCGYWVFDLRTVAGSLGMLWTSMAVCFGASASLVIGSCLFLRSPVAVAALTEAEEARQRLAILQEKYRERQKLSKQADERLLPSDVAGDRDGISHTRTGIEAGKSPRYRQEVGEVPVEHMNVETGQVALVLEEEPDSLEKDLPSRGWRAIARDSWVFVSCIFTSFFVTMNLFPTVGPLRWNYNQSVPCHFLLLIGLFSVGDIVGRSLFDLSTLAPRRLGCLFLGKRGLVILVFSRFLFYVPFFLGFSLHGVPVLNDFWWYVVLILSLSTTQGWVSTVGMVRACSSVVRTSEKEIVSPAAVSSLQAGIAAGLYVALAYHKLAP